MRTEGFFGIGPGRIVIAVTPIIAVVGAFDVFTRRAYDGAVRWAAG